MTLPSNFTSPRRPSLPPRISFGRHNSRTHSLISEESYACGRSCAIHALCDNTARGSRAGPGPRSQSAASRPLSPWRRARTSTATRAQPDRALLSELLNVVRVILDFVGVVFGGSFPSLSASIHTTPTSLTRRVQIGPLPELLAKNVVRILSRVINVVRFLLFLSVSTFMTDDGRRRFSQRAALIVGAIFTANLALQIWAVREFNARAVLYITPPIAKVLGRDVRVSRVSRLNVLGLTGLGPIASFEDLHVGPRLDGVERSQLDVRGGKGGHPGSLPTYDCRRFYV
jgi:hypothetical protein